MVEKRRRVKEDRKVCTGLGISQNPSSPLLVALGARPEKVEDIEVEERGQIKE